MSMAKQMLSAGKELEKNGHTVILPLRTFEYANGKLDIETSTESTENKIKYDMIRDYFNKISEGDSILVVNETKSGVENYIGGNSFLEMGFAHILKKCIYLLNPIPDMIYSDEIRAMTPIVLNGDLTRIKEGTK